MKDAHSIKSVKLLLLFLSVVPLSFVIYYFVGDYQIINSQIAQGLGVVKYGGHLHLTLLLSVWFILVVTAMRGAIKKKIL